MSLVNVQYLSFNGRWNSLTERAVKQQAIRGEVAVVLSCPLSVLLMGVSGPFEGSVSQWLGSQHCLCICDNINNILLVAAGKFYRTAKFQEKTSQHAIVLFFTNESAPVFICLGKKAVHNRSVAENPERENHVPYISLEVVVKAALNVAGFQMQNHSTTRQCSKWCMMKARWRGVLRNNQLMKRIVALYISIDVIWPLGLHQHLHS
ncbi:hypothetical protein V6N11_074319 [Hibiscus sabdariffa]|uniref:Uncharacterized protein n=1 Tax=Hibiscus sabdariffa TaxID=183260 RepID=A0ABR2R386_9ROSI